MKLWMIAAALGAIVVIALVAILIPAGQRPTEPVAVPPITVTAVVTTSATAEETPGEGDETAGEGDETAEGATSGTCWDGQATDDVEACAEPNGAAGLKYIFPGLDANLTSSTYECSYVEYPKREDLTFSFDCPLNGQTIQTTDQLVRYRYWEEGSVSLAHYNKVFADGSSENLVVDGAVVGTVFSNASPKEYGRYVKAFVLLGGRMVLSVEGGSFASLDEMLGEVKLRAAGELVGYTGTTPTEGEWTR